ncbi:hypothetical protein [Paraburkholderia fungorum]|uniref:Uncharacterized protein n=1 Tax=Paraburkholderia fungorum TaxID=134537 RepID=A0A3R7E1G6_9BURK|nr:hypothetical protein [Paraburkholderia fungorum]RKF34535.1 hypothetical protein BCY88_37835 [Paraburkholderia fungorum]
MNRPLALIEGDLAIPKPRPFDGLPPPFGSRRRAAWDAAQRGPQLAARTVAQQAIQDAVQRKPQPARTSPFPPGVRHVLFYKAPPQRSDAHRFDAEMAEAKRYLEMGKVRPRSSRSDYVAGATIFLGCGIALAWLLVTCTTRDAEKATTLAVTRPVVSAGSSASVDHSQEPVKLAQLAVEETQTDAQSVPLRASAVPTASSPSSVAAVTKPPSSATSYAAAEVAPARSEARHTTVSVALAPSGPNYAVPTVASASHAKNDDTAPKVALRSERRELSQRALQQPTARASTREAGTSRPAIVERKVAVARMTEAHVDERLALSSKARPATRPSVSKQPEWTARASAEGDTFDKAALLNWAAQQRAHVTTRAAVPVPAPGDTDWSARMTQRRITDNPGAFQAGRDQK